MKPLLLVLLLAGCSNIPPGYSPAQLCAVQIVRVLSETLFIARQRCEPEGVPI